ncbi:MAG TPA: C4-type zinc ribbon domain-containing protein [Tepidisphaeraceae bacterium]|nr:C4-type zinc ribbon domain-containing protein [Tepidisphaeraceae bacterium]
MGPTNTALVSLYKADQQLRTAQAKYDSANKDVRVQQRRVDDLAERQRLAHARLMEVRSQSSQVELDLKTRDEHIEKLRTQQQNSKNNKEYQAFLVEINTEKVDKNKIEEELIKLMEQVEKGQADEKELTGQLESEKIRLETMKKEIEGKLVTLQQEIDSLRGPREKAFEAVPPKARDVFERLADRHEGEAMSALGKPDRRREQYICTACNMELVTDVYNKLHSRDELQFCPSCQRILYIPEELPPETAVHKKKIAKPRKAPEIGAAPPRQQSAVDVLNSVMPDEDDLTDSSGHDPQQ